MHDQPIDHDPEPDPADLEDGVVEDLTDSLRDVEPDWEAAEADVLDQHRSVPLDDDR